jgi:hypothetical protein
MFLEQKVTDKVVREHDMSMYGGVDAQVYIHLMKARDKLHASAVLPMG